MGTSIKPTGFEHAAAALRYWSRRQEVVANNLANVDTDGFKGERTFAQLLEQAAGPVAGSTTDRRIGTITTTGQPLDLALMGDGFFQVRTPQGDRLSRGGAFGLTADRQLVDARGHVVLDEQGQAITIPADAARIDIDANGAVTADGAEVGRLNVVRPAANAVLTHMGDSLFAAASTTKVPDAERQVRQGARESSNVNAIESMVDMIAIQRATGSVQKALTTLDAARGIAVGEIGKTN